MSTHHTTYNAGLTTSPLRYLTANRTDSEGVAKPILNKMESDTENPSARPSESPPIGTGGKDTSSDAKLESLARTTMEATPDSGNAAASVNSNPSSTTTQHFQQSTTTTTSTNIIHDRHDAIARENGNPTTTLTSRGLKQEAADDDNEDADADAGADADADMESPDVVAEHAKRQT